MWHNHRLLNGIATGLYAVACIIIAYAVLISILRLSIFSLREVQLSGSLKHTTRDQVESLVSSRLTGNFFTLDLEQARTAFQKLPWVRTANLRRQWPDRLEVEIEEHVALARWRDIALVNTYGEVFEAATDETLPVLAGPDGTSAELVDRYAAFAQALVPVAKRPVQVVLSERRAWQVKLDSGDVLELGREQMDERVQRFVHAYARTLGQLPTRPYRIDLRYPNGFAVRGGRARGA